MITRFKIFKNSDISNLRCTIDIRFLSVDEIVRLSQSLVRLFPDYGFNVRFLEISKNNPDYVKWLGDYTHIELARYHTWFEGGEYDSKYYFSHSGTIPVDGSVFLDSKNLEEVEAKISAKKYNL